MDSTWIRQFGHLCARGWLIMVRATGTSTLGFIVWTLAIAFAGWMALVLQKRIELARNHDPRPLYNAVCQSAMSGVYSFGIIFVVTVSAWAIFCAVAVYRDHNELVEKNRALTEEVTKLKTGSIQLQIKGWIGNQNQNGFAIMQMWLSADNFGEPSVLRNWMVKIHTSKGDIEGRHTPGQLPLKGSLNIPFLDAEFVKPVGVVSGLDGYVTFVIPGLNQQQLGNLHLDPVATCIVSAEDQLNRPVTASKSIPQLWNEGHETRRAH